MANRCCSSSSCISLALLIIIGLISVDFVQSQNQRVTLYENTGASGAFINIGANYVPNLAAHSFDNRARSACVTGAWLFYDLVNYNQAGNFGMEYIFGNNHECTNFLGLSGAVSSARYAGVPSDYRLPSLTLYRRTYFQGEEEYTEVDVPRLTMPESASLIITGGSNDSWTFYDAEEYTGESACIYPPPTDIHLPAFVYNTENVTIPHNSIRSVRKGCFGTKIVHAPIARQGFQLDPAVELEAE